jgi:hypothetical protein
MKTWKVVLIGFFSILLLDMLMHVETDPQWVLYIHHAVWFGFGCALGEARYEDKLIKAIKKAVKQ